MKKLLLSLALLVAATVHAADVKISQLPLGSAATSSVSDSFPYISTATNVTKRLTLWDVANIPTIVSAYAPKASPSFTGTLSLTGNMTATGSITAGSFIGALTGNATTATALAANPTDCSSDQFAYAIAANGNLTCSAVATSAISGILGVSHGGTGLSAGTTGGLLAFTGTTTIASTAVGSSGQLIQSAGAALPVWTTATYPGTTTANQLLYSSATNTVGGLATVNSSALVTNSSGIPGFTSGSTANRVLRTDGTTVSFALVNVASDLTGQVPIANGGTNAATATAGFTNLSPQTTKGDLIVYSTLPIKLGVGSDLQVLTADSTQPSGVKWATPTPSTPALVQVTKTAAYTTIAADDVIYINAASGNVTITLLASASALSKPYRFKRIDTSSYTVTLARSGSDLIDGETSQLLSPGMGVSLIPDGGTNYYAF